MHYKYILEYALLSVTINTIKLSIMFFKLSPPMYKQHGKKLKIRLTSKRKFSIFIM